MSECLSTIRPYKLPSLRQSTRTSKQIKLCIYTWKIFKTPHKHITSSWLFISIFDQIFSFIIVPFHNWWRATKFKSIINGASQIFFNFLQCSLMVPNRTLNLFTQCTNCIYNVRLIQFIKFNRLPMTWASSDCETLLYSSWVGCLHHMV